MMFPIINISIEKWNEEDLMDYITFDKFIYTNNGSVFNELYKDKLFCDCNGQVFKAIEKAELTQRWRNWLGFIPNIWRREIIFENTYQSLTVDELKTYLLARISELHKTDFQERLAI